MRHGKVVVVSKPLLLYSLHHPTLMLKAPLAVSLEYEEDEAQVIAYAHDLEVFGYGDSESEALNDLRRTVVDLYLELEEGQRHLTGEAEAIWRYLSQIIQDNRQRESC